VAHEGWRGAGRRVGILAPLLQGLSGLVLSQLRLCCLNGCPFRSNIWISFPTSRTAASPAFVLSPFLQFLRLSAASTPPFYMIGRVGTMWGLFKSLIMSALWGHPRECRSPAYVPSKDLSSVTESDDRLTDAMIISTSGRLYTNICQSRLLHKLTDFHTL
jgi:hypothetical protein